MQAKINIVFALSIYILFFYGCHSGSNQHEHAHNYQAHVGDITFDHILDDPTFLICHDHQILQYYNFGKSIQYNGEKLAILKKFKEEYHSELLPNQTGYVSIRFVVNCQGETGIFRVVTMDNNYREIKMNSDITNKLLSITKSLDGWKIGKFLESDLTYDYYQYLTFKIEKGQLIKITP